MLDFEHYCPSTTGSIDETDLNQKPQKWIPLFLIFDICFPKIESSDIISKRRSAVHFLYDDGEACQS